MEMAYDNELASLRAENERLAAENECLKDANRQMTEEKGRMQGTIDRYAAQSDKICALWQTVMHDAAVKILGKDVVDDYDAQAGAPVDDADGVDADDDCEECDDCGECDHQTCLATAIA